MKRITLKFIPGVFLAVIFLLSSCTSAYKVTKSEGTMVAIDSTWDVNPDAEAVALLAAAQVLGKPADMGLINMGGLRNVLTKGPITTENIYEILPFENSLCVLTMKGVYLKELFNNIAVRHGEGISGVQLLITKDGKLLQGTVGGRPIEDDQLYTIATIDYLADGNDGMTALPQAEKRECPDGATLRGLFMDYVERQTAAGKKITSRLEGRVTVKDE